MDSDFYEKENDKIVDLMIEHKASEERFKAPDCVCQTIIKRMEPERQVPRFRGAHLTR